MITAFAKISYKSKLLFATGLFFLILLTFVFGGIGTSAKSSEFGYSSESPSGFSGGSIIPASCESHLPDSGDGNYWVQVNTHEGNNSFYVWGPGPSPFPSSVCDPYGGAIVTPVVNTPGNDPPSPVSIGGPITFPVGSSASSVYSFYSVDPDGDQIEYKIDWNMDQVIDRASGVVPSGTIVNYSFPIWLDKVGTYVFQAYAEDTKLARSPWTNYTVTVTPVTGPQCPCDTAANSCGLFNSGFTECNTACPLPVPSETLCPDPVVNSGYVIPAQGGGGSGGSGGGTGGGWTTNNKGSSQTVAKGQRCTIYWEAAPATSCTVTGPGVSASGKFGSVLTPRIGIDTLGSSIYTITCYNGKTKSSTVRFTCRMAEEFQEIN